MTQKLFPFWERVQKMQFIVPQSGWCSGWGENPRADESFEREDWVSETPSSSSELLYSPPSSSPSSRTVDVPGMSSGPDLEVPVHGRLLHVIEAENVEVYITLYKVKLVARDKSIMQLQCMTLHATSCMDGPIIKTFISKVRHECWP